jgi:hypothetical protein
MGSPQSVEAVSSLSNGSPSSAFNLHRTRTVVI